MNSKQLNFTGSGLEILDPLTYPGWDDIVLATRGHSIFHTSFWARVLHDSYGYRPCYLARIEDGKFELLVPLMEIRSLFTGSRGVSLPFTDYCDPIVRDHCKWQDVLNDVAEYGKKAKWDYVELRGGESWPAHILFSSSYYRHDLKLAAGLDIAYERLRSSTRRNIKKAIREGVTIRNDTSLDAVKTFFRFHCLTRRKHGVPPQPYDFFLKLHEHIICRNHGQVVLAARAGKTIAGAVFLHFGDEAIYKFGASDIKYQFLRPNDLIMWEAIQGYARRGHGKFSFGRTDPDNEGLLQFKRGWGAEERTIFYHSYDLKRNAYRKRSRNLRGFQKKIFGALPTPVLKLVGALSYKHMG